MPLVTRPALLCLLTGLFTPGLLPAQAASPAVPAFQVRAGYAVTAASNQLKEARFLETDGKGTIYVSQPASGKIAALRDQDGDGIYETETEFVTGFRRVQSLHFHKGWLWFGQPGAIHKARDTDGDGKAEEVVTVIPEGQMPTGGGHWYRPIFVTDDGFYTHIGDSGNINDETATDRQKIWHYNLDGTGKRLFSSGVRNNEKLRHRPGTTELWGADNGSDWFGKELGEPNPEAGQPVTNLTPPCEFNHYVEGGFYGHPFITGAGVPRIEFQKHPDILQLAAKTISPAWAFGPHWAPLGFAFLTQDYFPGQKGDAFVAVHGSWNSSRPVGYQVSRVLFDAESGKPYGMLPIVTTISADAKSILARPVDCLELPDGTVLFSSDTTKVLFRISKAK